MLWHFDELSEFARSGHGGFNATSDRGQIRPLRHVRVESVLPPTSDIDWRGRHGSFVPIPDLCNRSKATLYSITSSARASSVGGTSRPSAFAVARLITRSKRVAWSTGRSPGFAPLRMRAA